jgi:hypothetical protein
MEQALHDHFIGVFGTPVVAQTTLNFEALGIDTLDLSDQEADFIEEEVWGAIKALPSDKAPGLDRFTGAFYKASWHVIKTKLMAAIQTFANADNRNMAKLNNALIVLLPKKVGATSPGDFTASPSWCPRYWLSDWRQDWASLSPRTRTPSSGIGPSMIISNTSKG